jgi:hypothetical protein
VPRRQGRVRCRSHTTPRDAKGQNSWPGRARNFCWSARGVVATSDSLRYTQAAADPEDPHGPRRTARAAARRAARDRYSLAVRPTRPVHRCPNADKVCAAHENFALAGGRARKFPR